MGILVYGPLDGFYNKVGNLVGKRSKGRFVLSGIPRLTEAKRTPKQLLAQTKFVLLSRFLNKIEMFVAPGFKKKAKKIHPVKAACHYNYPHAFLENTDTPKLNFKSILYSKGDLLKACCGTAELAADGSGVVFSWVPRPESLYSQDTDLASFLIYDSKNDLLFRRADTAKRSDLKYHAQMIVRADAELQCYIHFVSADGKLRSDSLHVAELLAPIHPEED